MPPTTEPTRAGADSTSNDRARADELLRNVFVDLDAAELSATEMLARNEDPLTASLAHQTIAIVRRERGDLPGAVRHLRRAMSLGERAGDRKRRADAQATLGASLAIAGRTGDGLAQLDEAIGVLRGSKRAEALTRRAWIRISLLARFEDGADDVRRALKRFDADGDDIWLARALNLLGYARLGLGDLAAAESRFAESGELSRTLGLRIDHAVTVQNRGYVAYLRGDLPRAFSLFQIAAAAFVEAGESNADLVVDQCTAYLAAGLVADATATMGEALGRGPWVPRASAELLSMQAQVSLAAGDLQSARRTAERADRALTRQGREWFAVRARLIALTARHAGATRHSAALRRDALALVDDVRRLRMPEHTQALLLAASVHERHEPAVAERLLRLAEGARRNPAASERALGWLATARRRRSSGDLPGALRACEKGLGAVDELQALLGSSELRALNTARGKDLALLALQVALETGEPRRVLHWTERWRGVAAAASAASGDLDERSVRDLAALRAQTQRAAVIRDAGQSSEPFDRTIAELERRIRERHLARAAAGAGSGRASTEEVLAALAERDTTLLELLTVGDELHVLIASRGRVRRAFRGPLEPALRAQEYAGFVLRRAGRGQAGGLAQAGARLQETLLGDAARLIPEGPVVVSASNRLQRVPWALLPALGALPVSASPSAESWLRAVRRRPDSDRRVFVVGPGLASEGSEVAAIRRRDRAATYVSGADATVERTLEELEGAALVHLAAHGTFRADNPLFSSLDLADGPLLVHDLERLARPPHRIVLSACETGDMEPVGADELLGLSVSLLGLGSAGVISSPVPVNDQATAEVMTTVHARLRDGADAATAMLAAREGAGTDQLGLATAASFTAFGV